jgi:ABC-2 type transport system ATP-binding protein
MTLAVTDAAPGRVGSSAPDEPFVSLRELTKRFAVRRTWRDVLRHPTRVRYAEALSAVTCEVRRGEFVGLLGPNGAGKSTLFRVLATLVIPDGGTAAVAGLDVVRDARRVRSRVALVSPDERSLDWRLSARENLRFYGALYRMRGAALQRAADRALAAVGLTDSGPKLVGTFSSGMRQRLLIARALLRDPEVLLLDEPTRSLDPMAARQLRQLLRRELVAERGCTVLLATHSAEEALELCDRVAILHRGRLLTTGTPRELAGRLGNERFQVWTKSPDHAAFRALLLGGSITGLTHDGTEDGWAVVSCDIPRPEERASMVLAKLVLAGAEIARFQKVSSSLADVMEHVLRTSRDEG